MFRRCIVALTLIISTTAALGATQGGPIPVPLPLFPANNWWNTDVSAAPLDVNSATYITHIGPTVKTHPDWGGDVGDGTTYGIPYIIVDGSQAKKTVTFVVPEESDGVTHGPETPFPFYPIPDEAIATFGWIEGGPPGNMNPGGDRHMLIVDKTNNTLYEMGQVFYNGTNWTAYSGAFFDMKTNNRRPDTWTSADAAGLAILPGLVRYDEVYGPNEITHAFRFTVSNTNGYFFPASHTAGNTVNALPMGGRLRLKASKDISVYPADVQKIFRALKKYGLIVADNGSNMYIQGNYDNGWNMDVMNTAFQGSNGLTANDFEVVQLGWQPSINFILTLPTTMGANDTATATLTAYNSSYAVATGYTGTVRFTSTDGAATLPMDYTFAPGDAGSHTFSFTLRTAGGQTVYATDMADATITTSKNVIVGPTTPTGLNAVATTGTHVDLTWNASPTASQYEIFRASAGVGYASLGTVMAPATTFPDNGVTALKTYVYQVRAIDASTRPSPLSVPDAATTMFFTDDPLVANTTVIQAVHITDLRQAVNLMRAAGGLGAVSFTDPDPTGIAPRAIHITEIRTALTAARNALGLPPIGYTDAALSGLVVKAIHVQELRSGVK